MELRDSAREFLAEIEKKPKDRSLHLLNSKKMNRITSGEKDQRANNTLKNCRMVFENFSAEDYNRQANEPSTNTNL